MSYPQPTGSGAVLSNALIFRLRTELSSPGDIYESDEGGLALAIGPDSDIANIRFAYFDPQSSTLMTTGTFSPQRAFVGLVASQNTADYPTAKRPGRILFWADDIYDPNYVPSGAAPGSTVQFIPPIFDIVQYLSTPTALTPARPDKKYLFQNYTTTYFVVPYYGRKYAYIQYTNRNATNPSTYGIRGVNFAITNSAGPAPYHQETTIVAAAAVAPNASVTTVITAKNQGCFDCLVFQVSDNPGPLVVLMSDVDQG